MTDRSTSSVSGVGVEVFVSVSDTDGATVIQIDTNPHTHIRVCVNEGDTVYDGDPDAHTADCTLLGGGPCA
ncbi:hypothetical protein [Nocardia transvalensis]|uniref:hypothetical protein n=1 Tax=Nocardia transvalensis TaxID=37333 RepID=UPI0018953972|nr:hypothetical protein [Nocardia transvalensis]MBF6332309.1 hypothetical protein [Nocardia transvalensis]